VAVRAGRALIVPAPAPGYKRQREGWPEAAPFDAIMITAASTDWGRWWSNGVKNRSVMTTVSPVKTLESPETAPAWRLMADLEKEPDTG